MSEQQHDLEREALESLVASDLSAKMAQWQHNQPPSPPRRPVGWLLAGLIVLGGIAWWTLRPVSAPSPAPETPAATPGPDVAQAPTPAQVVPDTPAKAPTAHRQPSSIALAQSYYKMPDFASAVRGETSPVSIEALETAQKALLRHQYSETLGYLKQVPEAYRTDRLYLEGHAYFGQKKFENAAASFGAIKNSVKFGEAAVWYQTLALAADLDRNKDQVVRQLTQMANDNGHIWQEEAKAMLKAVR